MVASLSGCLFAPAIGKRGVQVIHFSNIRTPPDGGDAETVTLVEGEMEVAAHAGKAVLVTFPLMRSAADVSRLVVALRQSDRWDVAEEEGAPADSAPGLRIAMTRRTANGQQSRVMGLAPLGSMPVTRRAPYVALCAWLGAHANEHRPRQPGATNFVGFADMPSGVADRTRHDALFDGSRKATEEMARQTDEGSPGHKLTFRLDDDCRAIIFP
jgi:hypothetical protein